MAVRTSSQSGNWSLSSTWGGAAPPGNGDQAVINHEVTVTDDRIIGLSEGEASVNYAIQVSGTGSTLIIASGGVLHVRGNSRLTGASGGGHGDVEVQGGGVWEFDSSQAADPTNQNYFVDVGTTSVELNCAFRVTGTSFSNVGTVRSNASGGNGYIKEVSNFNGGLCDWNYFYALRLGTDTIRAVSTDSLDSSNAFFNFQNGDFEACGGIRATGFATGPAIRVINCRFFNSIAGTTNVHLQSTSTTPVGVRIVSNNFFDRGAILAHRGLTCEDNVFGLGYDTLNAGQKFASFKRNLVRMTNDIKRFHDGEENYWICDGNTMNWVTGAYTGGQVDVNNPHWMSADSNSLSATYRETSSIFEDFGSTGDGDIQYPSSTSGVHNEYYYCLVLPSQSRVSASQALNAGTMATINGASGHAHHFVNCTHFGGGQGFLALAEGGAGFAGMINQLHSNLYWNSSHYSAAGFNFIAYDPTGGAPTIVDDTIVAANCGWNCHFGCRTNGVEGAYNVPSTGTLGQNDINQNPQFYGVSDINNAATYKHFYHWVRSITGDTIPGNGSPTDRDFNAWGLYLLSLHNRPDHPDFHEDATLANAKAWIRLQYTPTNQALKGAGKDGQDIGAVAVLSSFPVELIGRKRRRQHRRRFL